MVVDGYGVRVIVYDMVSLFFVEVGVLLVEQFLVDDISHGLVLAADGR